MASHVCIVAFMPVKCNGESENLPFMRNIDEVYAMKS